MSRAVLREGRLLKRAALVLVVSVVFVGVLFLAVFPTRTYLEQRRELKTTERKAQVLADRNEELSAKVARLNTDAEIERLARKEYNLVRPGEEAYAILPPPQQPAGDDDEEEAKRPKKP